MRASFVCRTALIVATQSHNRSASLDTKRLAPTPAGSREARRTSSPARCGEPRGASPAASLPRPLRGYTTQPGLFPRVLVPRSLKVCLLRLRRQFSTRTEWSFKVM
ncbi:hypothetical protein AOLI_G00202200 [Acnodon oligacanthus]